MTCSVSRGTLCVCVYIDELLSVKASITSLPSGTDADDLEVYFEAICYNVEILSSLILGGGKAEVVLKGLTTEGMNKLEQSSYVTHIINKCCSLSSIPICICI